MQEPTRLIDANGQTFAVDEIGSGDRVALLLHGFPENRTSWRHQMAPLAALGWHVVAPRHARLWRQQPAGGPPRLQDRTSRRRRRRALRGVGSPATPLGRARLGCGGRLVPTRWRIRAPRMLAGWTAWPIVMNGAASQGVSRRAEALARGNASAPGTSDSSSCPGSRRPCSPREAHGRSAASSAPPRETGAPFRRPSSMGIARRPCNPAR